MRVLISAACVVLLAGCVAPAMQKCPSYRVFSVTRIVGYTPMAEQVDVFLEHSLDPCATFESLRSQYDPRKQ